MAEGVVPLPSVIHSLWSAPLATFDALRTDCDSHTRTK